jgi:hypothetical protein
MTSRPGWRCNQVNHFLFRQSIFYADSIGEVSCEDELLATKDSSAPKTQLTSSSQQSETAIPHRRSKFIVK